MWTTLICYCLQCLWQRWQTSLCASEKPASHNAEWKSGAVGRVGEQAPHLSLPVAARGCTLYRAVCGGNALSHRLAFQAPQRVRYSMVCSTRKPGTLERAYKWDFCFSNYLALVWGDQSGFVSFWFWLEYFCLFVCLFLTRIFRSSVCTMLRALQSKNVKQLFVWNLTVLYR